ncbi:hypothetical protein DFP72DRAFT_530790 [Ephemerocybe angulata]|uniref:F-box domain-containing protein n=1 Tax=Ephemerocybe angulata TaxID=980116 RepID=A0A8H6IFL9_9AGAR|nr:hypothetical protein DFP72DRAFT_530790 [Tulosesus angulatus]
MDQPRLTHLLNSRTVLDPLEIKSIRHEVHVRTQAISRLQLELQKLESERAAWQSLLSPLRRNSIPPKILGEIFGFVLLATERTKPRRSQVNLLCLVCKAWRDVALAIPSLWAQLDEIVVRNHFDVAKVGSWLSRAGNTGKMLSIVGQHLYPKVPNSLCPFASSAVQEFLSRGPGLNSLSLKCKSLQCFTELLKSTPSHGEPPFARSFDSLHSITLGFSQWPSSPDACHLLDHLPPVTSLTLDLPEPDEMEEYDSQESPLPRSIFPANLTKLCIRSTWPIAWILKIVDDCINLEGLVLEYGLGMHHVDEEMQTSSSKIILPKLRSLKLREISVHQQTTRILRYLVVPSLKALEIVYEGDQEPLDELSLPKMKELCADMLSLVSGSNAVTDLQYLRLENLPIASVSLYRILSAFPSLRHLTLDYVESDSALFRYSDIGDEPPLFLELEVLEMLNVPPSFDPDDICIFFNEQNRSLKRLFMTIVLVPSPGEKWHAEMLSRSGTDVSISYIPPWYCV